MFFYEHRLAEADRAFHRVLESHPDNAMAQEGLGHLQTMLGNCAAGGEYAAKLTKLWPGSFLTQSVLWNLSACQGDVARARKLLDQAAPKIPPFYAAASYAVLGDKERARVPRQSRVGARYSGNLHEGQSLISISFTPIPASPSWNGVRGWIHSVSRRQAPGGRRQAAVHFCQPAVTFIV